MVTSAYVLVEVYDEHALAEETLEGEERFGQPKRL